MSRWIVNKKRIGLGLGAALRFGLRRNLCMVAAFEEEPLVCSTGRKIGIARETEDVPYWLSSTARRFDLGSLVPSFRAKSQVNAVKIDGKAIADQIKRSLARDVMRMNQIVGGVPGLAMIWVGERKDSELYVRGKQAACAEVGINSYVTHFPDGASEAEILEVIHELNSDPQVHGILVQLPLPTHIQQENVLEGLSLEKDVDGLHPMNLSRLVGLSSPEPTFIPCTPLGCMELLFQLGIDVEKKRAVVIGSSSVVGLPTAILLQKHKADVTIVHLDTPNPMEATKQADIVISATGVPQLVRGHWLKAGAVVIDVGTSALEDPEMVSGFRVIGDVCYHEAERVASAITPVPGGVGPMTIAMLLSNTVKAAQRSFGLVSA